MDLTGIHNTGEFYSHHYLDALLATDLKGLMAQWRPDPNSPDKRLNGRATDYFKAKNDAMRARNLSGRVAPSRQMHVSVLEALGYSYRPESRPLDNGETGEAIPVLAALERDGRPYLWLIDTPFGEPDQSPLEHPLLVAQFLEQDQGSLSALGSREGSLINRNTVTIEDAIAKIFRQEAPPRWIILFAGQDIYLIDRTKWGQAKYLRFELDDIFGRKQTDTLRAVAALLSKDQLLPEDGMPLHDTIDENSHKHAYGVSTDLKFGVRRSVELLANEYVYYRKSKNLKGLEASQAKELTRECLTYLYRLLFIFYVEARDAELGLVPMSDDSYRRGYSLETLRDLEQVPLNTPQAQNGTFIHQSLNKLFDVVNGGYPPELTELGVRQRGLEEFNPSAPETTRVKEKLDDYGFTVTGLQSPLFDGRSTPMLAKASFRNVVLQEIIQLLSLSKEGKGKKARRGRISYAQLGINQLGAVYEGLLSYTGFFAAETLYEVKPAGKDPEDEKTQTYFIPQSDLEKYTDDEFIWDADPTSGDGRKHRRRYPQGTFIFRLAGRDRQKSASYYTPESLTQCTVKYSLKELLGERPSDPNWKTADEILQLTICEPAMGSGAFINEAINQVAEAYLIRKQQELGQTLSSERFALELQKVKAHLALHNAYGVDLNPMAVELAQVSIWLNTLYPKMAAPWYEARLASGNSLVGARNAVYSAEQLLDGSYKAAPPTPVQIGQPRPDGSVYHWLLPDSGMAPFDKDRVIKEMAPASVEAIKSWRKKFTAKINTSELEQLQNLSDGADRLMSRHIAQRLNLLRETATEIDVWGVETARRGVSDDGQRGAETRQRHVSTELSVEEKRTAFARLKTPTSATMRLKQAYDYWCALWFWPIPQAHLLPTRREWLADMSEILLSESDKFEVESDKSEAVQASLFGETDPPTTEPEATDHRLPKTPSNLRLHTSHLVSTRTPFHHWELAFADVFASRGGFDLIVGNPPWVKLEWKEGGVLGDYRPELDIRKQSASQIATQRREILQDEAARTPYFTEFAEANGGQAFLNGVQNYPLLKGIQTNLYKCFITLSWEIGSGQSAIGLVHPVGVFDDSRGGPFRREIYPRLNRYYQFHNEIHLFAEVDHHTRFGIFIYDAEPQAKINFEMIVNLFQPSTIDICYAHDGFGSLPGIKNEKGKWDVRGHRQRVVPIELEQIATLGQIFEKSDAPADYSRLPMVHSREIMSVLQKFALQENKLGDYEEDYFSTEMWHETNAQKDGTIQRTCSPAQSAHDWVISGPHIFVATPFNKSADEGCKSNLAYSRVDHTSMAEDYLPRTVYTPACDAEEYARRTPTFRGKKITDFYRHVHRKMLSQSGERTLINAIMPPGPGHIFGVFSISFSTRALLLAFSGLCSSVPYDFFIKASGKSNMLNDLASLLPLPINSPYLPPLIARTLRLNCLTNHYAPLWADQFTPAIAQSRWSVSDPRLSGWGHLGPEWGYDTPLRNPFERRQALVEIDVLAALALGLTLDELLTIYRVQFPVLIQNERKLLFDQRGHVVPVRTSKGELLVNEKDEAFSEMVGPFTPVSREEGYARAWEKFE